MRWWRRWVKRLRAVVRRGEVERELTEELELHIDLEVQKQLAAGVSPEEARRRALVAFGGVERYKELVRNARRFDWLHGLSLDCRLGLRMLVKYPGLAVVGCIALAVAIAIGATSFTVIRAFVARALPLDDGDRIVAIQNLDVESSNADASHTHLHDSELWRAEVAAISEWGAYRTLDRNIVTADGRVTAARIAELTGSGFRIARVNPLLGRYFVDADERPDAPPVVVIGHTVWQNQLSRDPHVVGKTIRLGRTVHTIVGVMPRGYAFPINNRIWTPLRLDPLQYERGVAPSIAVFGRLADGATLREAQAQLTTIAQRRAAEHPRTHEHIRTRVVLFPRVFMDSPQLTWALYLVQLSITLILVVIGANVAVLVYARTLTRTGEIAVRTALGASRSRIVSQLFVESLVLSSAAAVTGLVAAHFVLRQVRALLERLGGEQMPFWWDFSLTPAIVAYAAGLAVLGAVIVGVLPALELTGRHVLATLQHIGSGGPGIPLGRTWTVLIVVQVALASAVLPIGLGGARQSFDYERTPRGPTTTEILTTELRLDRETSSGGEQAEQQFRTRYEALQAEFIRRLHADAAVAAVVRSTAPPGRERSSRIELESVTAAQADSTQAATQPTVRAGRIDTNFFAAFDLRVLAGRAFDAGDFDARETTAVVVNSAFVEHVLGGAAPLGRRVRYAAESARAADPPQPWYEIVGVVSNLTTGGGPGHARIYHPLPRDVHPVNVSVRIRGTAPEMFAGRARQLAVAVDPMLRLGNVATVDRVLRDAEADDQIVIQVIVAIALSALLLAAAGISALMSVTVARRRREIGILMALGAPSHRVLGTVLARAAKQLALGVAGGIVLLGAFFLADGDVDVKDVIIFAQIAGGMTIIGMVAAIGPARRGLRIQPTEALRQD